MVVSADGTLLDANQAFWRLAGRDSATEAVPRLTDVLHADDREPALAFLQRAAGSPQLSETAVWRMDGGVEGSECFLEAVCHNQLSNPSVGGLILSLQDVSQAKVLEQKLKQDAYRDALTGLANRVGFFDRVRIAISREKTPSSVAALFLDLDDFKTINDSLGHATGDELLMQIAGRITECLGPEDFAARLGGDEFAILLEGLNGPGQAGDAAQRIIETFWEPFKIGGMSIRAQSSVGVAVRDSGQHPEELLRDADVAMYVAKERGKGRYEYFASKMRDGVLARLELRDALQGALERGDFVLHYQPILDLHTGRVVGAEALLRWRDRERGLVAPSRFIGIAEQTGLMDSIGRWILRDAARQARLWRISLEDFRMSVNLSARQLDRPGLSQEVADALADADLAPESLVVEITEQVFMQESDRVLVNLHELKEIGVRLAIDDFGTGYSSLSYLQRFPADYLKVDRSFIEPMGSDRHKPTLARAVVEIAHSLGLEVVAEGIEHPEQLYHLRDLGCEYGQGFLFSKAVDNQGMGSFLKLDRLEYFAPQPERALRLA